MCGKLASYGRYYDNRNPTMGKLPKYNIVKNNKNNSFTVTYSNFRTFRAKKIKGGKSDFFFILKLLLDHEPYMVYLPPSPPPPPDVFL